MRIRRRDLLRSALAAGGLGAVSPLARAWAASSPPTTTPAQTKGPFYPVTRPLDADADLTVIRGRSGRAQGRVLHLMGRVLDRDGKPVPGAKIELWQANAAGRYAHPRDVNPAPLDPNFQGFGTQVTDDDGQFRFKTIKPAAYPVNPMNPRAVRTPHIHFDIAGTDVRLVTQMYFPDEASNDADLIFRALSAGERRAATASLVPASADVESDALVARWDIVLAGG